MAKSSKKSEVSIGDLLNPAQKKILTSKARSLTHADLSKMQSDPTLGGTLGKSDRKSILKLALVRANNGQTVFTYSHMKFDTGGGSDDGEGVSNW